MGEERIRGWMAKWDQSIATWAASGGTIEDPALVSLRKRWLGRAREPQAFEAVPEPWVGDPLHEDLLAVVLGHNPGPAVLPQLLPDGDLVRAVRSGSKWSELAAGWNLAEETRQWWSPIAAALHWNETGTNLAPGSLPIVGLDLLPFHSESRRVLRPGDEDARWLRDNVLGPAAAIAARAKLRVRIGRTTEPVVLALHQHTWEALGDLGAESLCRLDPYTVGEGDPKEPFATMWPERLGGSRSIKQLDLCRVPIEGGHLHVLASWCDGGVLYPGKPFRSVVRWLLDEALAA